MPDAQTRLEDILFRSYWADGIVDIVWGIALIYCGGVFFFRSCLPDATPPPIPLLTAHHVAPCAVESSNSGPALSNSRVGESAGVYLAWPSPTSSSQPCFWGPFAGLLFYGRSTRDRPTDLFISGVPGGVIF